MNREAVPPARRSQRVSWSTGAAGAYTADRLCPANTARAGGTRSLRDAPADVTQSSGGTDIGKRGMESSQAKPGAEALKAKLDEWAGVSGDRSREVGDAFERLCVVHLSNDPVETNQISNPRPYATWARERGLKENDTGIDPVADLNDGSGRLPAIQCRFRRRGGMIAQHEIDSFVAKSNRPEFGARILIETSGREWSANAERRLDEVDPPIRRLGRHRRDLRATGASQTPTALHVAKHISKGTR